MKLTIPALVLIIVTFILGAAHSSLAGTRTLSSNTPKVTCSNGGKYKHSGSNSHSVRKATTDACFDSQLEIYQQQRGALPDDTQADLIIEACLNRTVCS